MNSRLYVAVNESSGKWYDPNRLIGAIKEIAAPFNFGKYGLKPLSLKGVDFFEIIGKGGLIALNITQRRFATSSRVVIASYTNPRITKARLEARAESLELRKV